MPVRIARPERLAQKAHVRFGMAAACAQGDRGGARLQGRKGRPCRWRELVAQY
jgi:hypothetical protein